MHDKTTKAVKLNPSVTLKVKRRLHDSVEAYIWKLIIQASIYSKKTALVPKNKTSNFTLCFLQRENIYLGLWCVFCHSKAQVLAAIVKIFFAPVSWDKFPEPLSPF